MFDSFRSERGRDLRQAGAGLIVSILGGAIGALVILLLISSNATWRERLLPAPGALVPNGQPVSPDGPSGPLTSEEGRVVETVKKTSPAVVSIVVSKDVPVVERFFTEVPGSPFDDFFSPFRFRVPQLQQRGTERREVGGGSGFLVSADGLIVTNRHVVEDMDASYTVFTSDGTKHEATVVARDPANDIAIVKVTGTNFPHLEFGNSDQLEVGQTTIAIGNALSEFQNTVSVGVVSGLSRSITAGDAFGRAESLEEVIQTDAAINPGNSGGPLLNLQGQVIGVNVAIAAGSENIGFALPANSVKSVVDSVKANGKIVRPYLGVRYVAITPLIAEQNRLSVDYGMLVIRGETPEQLAVIPNSPAAKAGIVENDIILEIDGKRLDENTSLAKQVANKKVGDTVTLKVLHDNTERNVTVTLEAIPESQ